MNIKVLCVVVFVLNLLDALLTHYLIKENMAYEYNFVMDCVIKKGWVWFYIIKIAAASGILYILFNNKQARLARVALYIWVVFYSAVVINSLYVITL